MTIRRHRNRVDAHPHIDVSLWQWDVLGRVKPYGSRTWRDVGDGETPWSEHGRQARILKRCKRQLGTMATLEHGSWNRRLPASSSSSALISLISTLLLLARAIPAALHLGIVTGGVLATIWSNSTTGNRQRSARAARQFRRHLDDPAARPIAIALCSERELERHLGNDEHGEDALHQYLSNAHGELLWQAHATGGDAVYDKQHGWKLALARELARCADVNGHTLVAVARLDRPDIADRFDAIRTVWNRMRNWDVATQQLAGQMAEHWHGRSSELLEAVHALGNPPVEAES